MYSEIKKVILCLTIMLFVFAGNGFTQEKKKPEFIIKFGTVAPTDTPWHQVMLGIKKDIEMLTNHRVEFQLFFGGQLGGELQMVEAVQMGVLESWGGSTGALESFVPEFGVFDLPFLWESDDECYYIMDNVLKKPLFDKLEKVNLHGVAWTENGWRNFATRNKPIHTPDDLKGLKFRSQESKVHLAFWKALGANAIPISMAEVFNAIQTGIVDGADNSLIMISATGWWDVLKYVTISKHIYQPAVIVINKEFWYKLPEDIRNAVAKAMTDAQPKIRKALADFEPELIEAYKEKGNIVNVLTPEERALFKEKTKGVAKQFEKQFGEVLKLIYSAQEEFRKKHKK